MPHRFCLFIDIMADERMLGGLVTKTLILLLLSLVPQAAGESAEGFILQPFGFLGGKTLEDDHVKKSYCLLRY